MRRIWLAYYDIMSADQRTSMINDIIKQTAPDAVVKNSKAYVSSNGAGK